MRTVDEYGTFDEALAKAGDRARELAYQLRELVAQVMSDAVEVPWPRMRMAYIWPSPQPPQEGACRRSPRAAWPTICAWCTPASYSSPCKEPAAKPAQLEIPFGAQSESGIRPKSHAFCNKRNYTRGRQLPARAHGRALPH